MHVCKYVNIVSKYVNELCPCECKWLDNRIPMFPCSAAVEAVEAALALAYPSSKPVQLSVQLAVSCTNSRYMTSDYLSAGCSGGYPDEVMGAMSYKVTTLVRSHMHVRRIISSCLHQTDGEHIYIFVCVCM